MIFEVEIPEIAKNTVFRFLIDEIMENKGARQFRCMTYPPPQIDPGTSIKTIYFRSRFQIFHTQTSFFSVFSKAAN